MERRKEDANQLNLFDVIIGVGEEVVDEFLLPIFLREGDVVWKVELADVTKYTVTGKESWTVGNKYRGYRLQSENGTYDVANNDNIDLVFFNSEEEAKFHADLRAKKYDMIRAEKIHFTNIEAYSFVRECDERKMVAFQAEIGNGLLYEKNYYTFDHIVKDTPKNRKAFQKDVTQHEGSIRMETFHYTPKNMYPCNSDSGWVYAEAGYSGTKKHVSKIRQHNNT